MSSDEFALVCAGDQSDMQKLKDELAGLKTKLKEAAVEAKNSQKFLEKAKARAATLDTQLKLMRQEQDEHLQQMQLLEKDAQQQKEQEAQQKLKTMEQEVQELREKLKTTTTKTKRPRQPEFVPVACEDEDLDDIIPLNPTPTAAPPPKKQKQQIPDPLKQTPQPDSDSAAMIEAAVLRCMERFAPLSNSAAAPVAYQRAPQAPMPAASVYQQAPTYASGGPPPNPYGFTGHYGQAFPAPFPQMPSAGMMYAPPAMMPSMVSSSGGSQDQNAMMHMWPPQAPGASYSSTSMAGWGTSGAGGGPSYPGQQTAQMPMTASTGTVPGSSQSSVDPRSMDRTVKAATDFSQTGHFMTQEQQEAYVKFMQSFGGQ